MYSLYHPALLSNSHLHCYVCGGWLLGRVDVGHHHGGLEQGPLVRDAALLQLLLGKGHDLLLDGDGGFDVVDPVNENLRLDDGEEAILLADVGTGGQAVRSLIDGVVVGAVVCHIYVKDREPFEKPGPAGIAGDAFVVEAIEAAAPGHIS